MTCKDCIHQYCCKYDRFFCVDEVENKCNYFKNKADVVEVKHGEWLEVDSDVGWELVRCSLCGKEYSLCDGEDRTDYCPYCGAKMEGGKNDV